MGSKSPTRNDARSAARCRRLKVLIVDDDPDGLQALGALFGQAGLDVSLAGSAAEACRQAASFRPDALVSDLAMPGEDGFSLLRRLRGLERRGGPHCVAVAMSALTDPETRRRVTEEGFEAYFSKPVDVRAVLARLVQVCGSGLGH